jgi:hypothetical protein
LAEPSHDALHHEIDEVVKARVELTAAAKPRLFGEPAKAQTANQV